MTNPEMSVLCRRVIIAVLSHLSLSCVLESSTYRVAWLNG